MDVGAFHLCTNANGKLTIVLDEQLVFTESIKADLQRIQEVKAADSIDLRCLQFHGVSPNLLAETLQPWALSLTPFLVLDNIKRIQIATGSLTTILRGLCKKLLIQEFHNLVKHRQIGLFGQTLPMKSLFNVAQFTDKIQNSEVRTLKCKFCSRQRQSVPKIPKRQKPHLCYMCKQRPKDLPSTSTDKGNICNSCQLKNAQMSNLATDLTGKYAVVTGGRVKIGYQVVLKLLRDGCNVVVTTRFPIDAAKRYSKENDFHKWKNRLRIYPLDLQDVVGKILFRHLITK